MKSRYSLLALRAFLSFSFFAMVFAGPGAMQAVGQCPDPSYSGPEYMAPSQLPDGTAGQVYSSGVTIWIPSTYSGATVYNADLTGMSGLPTGLSYACAGGNCNYSSSFNGCVTISGTIAENVAPGTYPITGHFTAHTNFGSFPGYTSTVYLTVECAPISWYEDSDGDSYGNPAVTQTACTQPTGFVTNADDCNDSNPAAGLAPPAAIAPSGTGTMGDPYLIASFENLKWISENDASWASHFLQTADIDASITSNACYNAGAGWSPIGNDGVNYQGAYNGDGHTISGLFINRSGGFGQGLFGIIATATISSLGVIDADITDSYYIGVLVGYPWNSTITSCYSSGTIEGEQMVGGLIGYSENSTLNSCFNTAVVKGDYFVGGLFGYAYAGEINNSYSLGAVTGMAYSGGLVGFADNAAINFCFISGQVNGDSDFGGLIGAVSGGSVTHSFWDTEASGQATSWGGTGKTRVEMRTLSTFTATGWDFEDETINGNNDIWSGLNCSVNKGYPSLSWQNLSPVVVPVAESPLGSGIEGDPYRIANFNNLLWVSENNASWSSHFLQTADIDASITTTASGCFNAGTGWSPIGHIDNRFYGTYNGDRHTISGLFINSNEDFGGFFGVATNATISALGVIDADITGGAATHMIGILGGSARNTTVTGCYSSGKVNGYSNVGGLLGDISNGSIINFCWSNAVVQGDQIVGGLIGQVGSTIHNCYSLGAVSGTSYVGGLVGNAYGGTSIQSSYSTGQVAGGSYVGGLVGVTSGGSFINSFWDTETSGTINSANGGTGLTTAQMKTLSTFTNATWDFQCETTNGTASTWGINATDNAGYPFLSWQPYIHDGSCHIWTGATSTAWNTATNWSTGTVPTSSEEVEIGSAPTNQPIVSGALAECANVAVHGGASLTIAAANALTVYGNLTNAGTVRIKADASGMGSLITKGTIIGAGTFQAEQYLKGANNAGTPNGVFQYVSSPIAGATSLTYNPLGTNKLWSANEATQDYTAIEDNTTALNVGEGYVARVSTNDSVTHSGISFHTGDVNIEDLTRSAGPNVNNRGYNLIGNPYPSSVNWTTATRNNVETTLWYRTHTAGNLMIAETYNATLGEGTNNGNYTGQAAVGIIPPGQAFWVRVIEGETTGSVSFTNAMRLHGSQTSIYKQEAEEGTVRLKLGNGTLSDETIVHFNSEAQDSYDDFDSQKMWMNNLPQLYTTVGADSLVINGLFSIETNPIVDLGIKAPTAGNYTITASSITLTEEVWLEDRALNNFQHLNQNPVYAFITSSGNIGNRFALHFGMMAVGVEENGPTTHVFAADGVVNLSVGTDITTGSITILDMAGRTVQTATINGSRTVMATDLVTGIYLVRVETTKGTETHRVMLR